MSLVLRLAEKEDIDGIFDVETKCFISPWHFESLQYDVCDNSNSLYMIAIEQETIIGFCGVHIVLDECHINNVAVLPQYRRKGVAKALIELLISSTEKLIKMYWLEVRQSNIAAKKLYEKFGFEPITIRKKYYTDTNEDALIMCLNLSENEEISQKK